jgi:hypothetical protein
VNNETCSMFYDRKISRKYYILSLYIVSLFDILRLSFKENR